MSRKPLFWIALTILGLTGSILAFRLFPVAFPLLSVDIEMDRQEALDEALAMSGRFAWGPENPRQAASFGQLDPAFQTYMELEGGGLESLNRMVSQGTLQLYVWRVRQFQHEVVEETEVRFTAGGQPYGFSQRLSEDTPGINLPPAEARDLAMAVATETWGVEPARYELLESSQEEHPGGRVDHTFVYRTRDLDLGEAELRLRMRMAGNRLAELTWYYHVPDAFLQRFQDTRNANDGIALAGTILFILLFLLLAGGGGAIYLIRGRWLEWRIPLVWGAVVSGLMALGSLNGLPLAWMEYDTAIPPAVFVGTLVASAVGIFGAGTVFLAFLFMTGEGLLRRGFPDHVRQWAFWAPGVANSDPALGRTLAPYLVVGLELGYVVVFYLAMTSWAGWWSPASSLVEPDLLATRFPWLTAVGTSLFAAFSEETMFRAIPIGAAALMGRRFGKAGAWIWGTIVLQALVFAASHANYPQQPAYARVVEIFPTYLAWGAAVVYFGLVPAILGHFLYDLVFFSLPLFAADTGGVWPDRVVILAAGFLPLFIVILARARLGAREGVPEWARNRSWRPRFVPAPRKADMVQDPAAESESQDSDRVEGTATAPSGESDAGPRLLEADPLAGTEGRPAAGSPMARGGPLLSWSLGIAAVAGMVLWATSLRTGDVPRLTSDLSGAEAIAREALAARGTRLETGWTPLFSTTSGRGSGHEFVWEIGGEDAYDSLLGTFLSLPAWQVRFVRFRADAEARAEEYRVRIGPEGSQPSVSHILPEEQAGASLSEEEARAISLRALQERLDLEPGEMREVSAESSALPNRTDWTFTFSSMEGYALEEGEARAEIRIGGSEVTEARTYVDPPEDWEREYRKDLSRRILFTLPAGAILLVLGGAGVVLAIVRWARREMDTRLLWPVAGSMAAVQLITAINAWPSQIGGFSTRLGYGNQLALALFATVVGAVIASLGTGLLAALGFTWLGGRRPDRLKKVGLAAVALGVLAAGGMEALRALSRSGPPPWPGYSGAVSFLPWVSVGLGPLTGFFTLMGGGLVLFGAMCRLREENRRAMAWALAFILGFALAPNPMDGSLLLWTGSVLLVGGTLMAAGAVVCQMGWRVVAGAAGTVLTLEAVRSGMVAPFPGAAAGSLLAIVLLVGSAIFLTRAYPEA